MLTGILQYEVLHHEFDVAYAARTLLEVKILLGTFVELLAHFCAHRQHILEQVVASHPVAKRLGTYPFEFSRDYRTAGDGPATQ
jgi:hypothetical protein